ncbi:helix-turn-helix domain-containing protein [Ferroplasma sp.]|uniref:winged helix-turn-helix transcriptional regulator n=1 Tax=Ferroplasma sp. TaxID=2591003 RepID=UPI00307DA8B4
MRINDCPLTNALKPLKGKWGPLIIKYLSINGNSGYNEIYNSMENITPKALTNALHMLCNYSIIHKDIVSNKPVRVIYSLTDKGKAMLAPLDAIETLNGKKGNVK